jgi:iron complex outermembrane receptor protein
MSKIPNPIGSMCGAAGALLCAPALLVMTVPAPAQTQAGAALAVEEITVTARKQEESLQDVPISITAFTSEDIDNRGFRTLEDIGPSVPNFDLNRGQGYAIDTSISIRGITTRDVAAGFDPTVAVILDDVYIGRALGFNTTLLDLERLEVLRGPQGTLQGRNVVGGSLNLTTAKPADEFHARGRVSYGRFDTWEASGMVTGPLQAGVLAGKVAVSHRDGDGAADNFDLDKDQGGVEATALRAQLRFTPRPDLEILLTGDYTTEDIVDQGLDTDPDVTITEPSALLLDRDYGGDFRNDSDRDVYGGAINVYYDLANGMRLASITSYRGFELDSLLDQDSSANFANGGGIAVHSTASREQEQFSQELRLHSPQDGRVRWLLGFYYFHEDLDTFGGGVFGPYIPGVGALGAYNESDANVDTDDFAGFGSLSFDLMPALNFTVGLRYDNNQRDLKVSETTAFDGFLPVPPAPFVAISATNPLPDTFAIVVPLATTERSVHDEELTGDATLSYAWTEDVSTYAKYSRGFKGAGFNAQFAFGQAGGTVEPEFVNSYELGLRSLWLDRRVRLNATGFYMKYSDQQLVDFILGPTGVTFVTRNEPKTEIWGAEIEGAAVLMEGLDLLMSVGILDAEFERGANDGNEPFNSPDLEFSTALQYVRPIGHNLELFLFGEASYSDDYYTNDRNFPLSRQDAYWMLDVRGGIQSADARWALRGYGRNLLDEDIQTTAILANNALLAVQDPITWGIEASFRY